MMPSPNPDRTCETCAFSTPTYNCDAKIAGAPGSYGDNPDTCPIDGSYIRTLSESLPRLKDNEICRSCPSLAKAAIIYCHLMPAAKIGGKNDWCGQWQKKGAF